MSEFHALPHRATCWIVALCWSLMSVCWLDARQSEFELTRFVPADTCAASSLNVRAILNKVNLDDPLVAGFIELTRDGSGMDLAKLERVIVVVSSRDHGERDFTPPTAVVMQFEDALDPKQFLENSPMSGHLKFESVQYQGYEMFVGRFGDMAGDASSGPAWFFPEPHLVVQGNRDIVQQMIDDESEMSDGMELVNHLDSEAEFHVVMEGGDGLAGLLGMGIRDAMGIGELIRDVQRLEILVSYDTDMPIQVTLEMNSTEQLDQVMGLLNAGRVAAPGALDGLEAELGKSANGADGELEQKAFQSLRDLLALTRLALKETKIERDGTTVRLSLSRIGGLENLPQLLFQSMGSAMAVEHEAMVAEPRLIELEEAEEIDD